MPAVADTIDAIDAALAQPPIRHSLKASDQANAEAIAAIDNTIKLLADLRMVLDLCPDNLALVNGCVFDLHDALGDACAARARYLEATGVVTATTIGAH